MTERIDELLALRFKAMEHETIPHVAPTIYYFWGWETFEPQLFEVPRRLLRALPPVAPMYSPRFCTVTHGADHLGILMSRKDVFDTISSNDARLRDGLHFPGSANSIDSGATLFGMGFVSLSRKPGPNLDQFDRILADAKTAGHEPIVAPGYV